MFLDLTIAGVVEGYLWQNLAPWERSLIAAHALLAHAHHRRRRLHHRADAAGLQHVDDRARSRSLGGAPSRVARRARRRARRRPWNDSLSVCSWPGSSASPWPAWSSGYLPIAHLSQNQVPEARGDRARAVAMNSRIWRAATRRHSSRYYGDADRRRLPRGAQARARHLHRRGVLALPLAVRAAGLQRGHPLRQGVLGGRVHERNVPAAPLRHAPRGAGPHPRERRARATTGTWPTSSIPTMRGAHLGDAALHLVLRRRSSPTRRGLAIITYMQWLGAGPRPRLARERRRRRPMQPSEPDHGARAPARGPAPARCSSGR